LKIIPIQDLYSQIKKKEMGGACGTYGRQESCIQGSGGGGTEGKRSFGRPRHRWEDTIKICVQDVRWGGMDWIAVAQDRDRWRMPVNSYELRGSIKCGEFLE
jgi:sensor domain CHASE-containing protein